MKKIVVTGAYGFIGEAICNRLFAEGWVVSGGVRSRRDQRNSHGVSFFETGDIDASTNWTAALKGVDAVVHAAAKVDTANDLNPDTLAEFRRVNLQGTTNLARQAIEFGVKRFIFLSSVRVNGEANPIAYTETDKPMPRDAYGISKLEAEQALSEIAGGTGMSITILRPPVVYGPKVKAKFLKLIQIVDRGLPLPLASVDNPRSMIYIGNLADAIIQCVRRSEAEFKTYMVRDGVDISLPELIRKIASALGKPARLFGLSPMVLRRIAGLFGKEMEADRLIGSLTVDDSRIRQDLGWSPPFTIEHGIEKTIDWYRNMRRV